MVKLFSESLVKGTLSFPAWMDQIQVYVQHEGLNPKNPGKVSIIKTT